MLTGGLDLMYRAALATSHRPYLRIEILDSTDQVLLGFDETLPEYLSGSVRADLTSRVARTCTLTFDESLYPVEPTGILAPYGNIVRATRGIEFAEGTRFAWVVFYGRIQEATLSSDGTCTITASDPAADCIDVKFFSPENSQAGSLVEAEVHRLISDAVPNARFGPFDTFGVPVQQLTWQLDRGQALDELATTVGAFWYCLADGAFTLRRYPWTVPNPPVTTYADGPTGSVTAWAATRSRGMVYNSLTVTGERLNGDEPVYATAQDDNPASPTYINGNFGRRHQLLRLQTPATQGAALGAARDNLRRLTALVESWSWAMTPDAALELGDAVYLDVAGRSDIIQVVASYSIPLDLSGPMTVSGRSLVLGALEGV
jgi:hypothetical protein